MDVSDTEVSETALDGAMGLTTFEMSEASSEAQASLLEASCIGRYQILRELGSGGMGAVYVAYDESLDRRVAIKLLLRETSTTVSRLRREAQAMARISHPNVIQLFEVGEHEGQPFVAMEYLEGKSLRRWLAECSPTWSEIIDVFIDAGRGLQAAHGAGVVHRDFKPDNVMTQRVEGGMRVKVLDFGIASVGADPISPIDDESTHDDDALRLTRAGTLMGTPAYMSPEHFLGDATDPRSDQFSFAVALYEALYGQQPFAAGSFGQLRSQVLEGKLRAPPLISSVPAWVLEILARALAVDPAQRWSSMAELIDTLANHPERTNDPDLDRTVALSQRLWMFSVLTLGALSLLVVLVSLRVSASAVLEDFAFWSKVLFASGATVALLATKHVFMKNSYNKRVLALLLAISLATIATSVIGRSLGLSAEQTDRFVLIACAAVFGQASASVGPWLLMVPVLALVGLGLSFFVPFGAPVALGLCVVTGTALTLYFWARKRGGVSGFTSTSPVAVASSEDLTITSNAVQSEG